MRTDLRTIEFIAKTAVMVMVLAMTVILCIFVAIGWAMLSPAFRFWGMFRKKDEARNGR